MTPASAMPRIAPTVPTDPTARIAQLERDLASARARAATLRRELVRLVAAPIVIDSHVIDGMLTITTSTGAVIQRRPHVVDTPTECEFGFRWESLPPAPDTPAAIADAVFADDSNLPAALYALPGEIARAAERQQHHHTPTFRALAQLALRGGMAVSAGDES